MDSNINTVTENTTAAGRMQEIDLVEIFHVLWHRIWLLVLAAVIGAAAVGIATKLFVTPLYTASSTIYVFSKSTSITSIADLQISNQLTGDFQFIATTRETINAVIDELNLDTTYGALVKTISVTNPSSTHMLTVKVTNPDPKLAADISNTLSDVIREQIADIMNTDMPSSVERAVVPTSPSSPSLTRNAAIGGIALLAIVVAAILIHYFADDTITTEEDIRRYLGINVLGAIPFERSVSDKEA